MTARCGRARPGLRLIVMTSVAPMRTPGVALVVAVFVALLVPSLVVPATTAGTTRIAVGTGPWSGVFFPVGGALAELLTKHLPGVEAVPVPVTGSAHALELLHRGELTIAIVGLAAAHFGVRGEREFDRKYDDVAFVMAGMDTGQSLVTRVDSGIKTFADVRGMRVAANTPASRAELLEVLALYGVKDADARVTVMNYAEQIAGLREGSLDAGFLAISPRDTDVASLAADQRVRILALDPDKAQALQASPFWTPVRVKAGTYRGQDHDVLVPGAHTTLLAHAQADPGLIYDIVKVIVEHRRDFGELHPGGAEFSLQRTQLLIDKKLVPVGFHPGAERYWKEKGLLK
jgi:uncharacterized protein